MTGPKPMTRGEHDGGRSGGSGIRPRSAEIGGGSPGTVVDRESFVTRRQATRDAQAAEFAAWRRRVVSAADRERARIERDLHDGAQQRLVAAAINLTRLEDRTDVPRSLAPALAAIRGEIETAIDEMRKLVHGIYPQELAQFGLHAAVAAIAHEMPVSVRFHDRDVPRLDPDIEAAVYFCCREALQNVAKHAGPEVQVDISLRRDGDGGLLFEIADDGVGFDTATIGAAHGVTGMSDRIAAVGGELTITSAPAAGCSVKGRVDIPGPRRAHAAACAR